MSAAVRYATRSRRPRSVSPDSSSAPTRVPDASTTESTGSTNETPTSSVAQSSQQSKVEGNLNTRETIENAERFLAVEANRAIPAYAIIRDLLTLHRRQPSNDPQLSALQKGLASLAQKVDQLSQPAAAPRSYAAVAGARLAAPPARPALAVQRQAQALRETIIQADSFPAEVMRMTSTQAVQAVNEALGADLARGARRLGELGGRQRWAIAFTTQEEKDHAEKTPDWYQKAFGEGASIYRHQYKIVSHGFNLTVVRGLGQERLLEQLSASNCGIKFATANPPKGHKDKERGPLFLSVEDTQQANILCRKGLFFEAQWHPCVPFCAEAQVIRCFNCHETGHTTKRCRGKPRCGWCSSTQHTDSRQARCPRREAGQPPRCSRCQGPHPAWSKKCPRWEEAAAVARDAFQHRPTEFFEAPQSLTATAQAPANTLRPDNTQEFTLVTSRRNQQRRQTFTTAEAISRTSSSVPASTKRRGRPPALQGAAEGSRPIAEMLQRNPPRQNAELDSITVADE